MSPESAATLLDEYRAVPRNALKRVVSLTEPTFEEFQKSGFVCYPAIRGTINNAIRCLAANGSWSFKRKIDEVLQHTEDSQELLTLAWKLSYTQFK